MHDEYDRRPRSRSRDRRRSPERRRPPELEEREWPPRFDTDGSAFVFDNRSGMFYEARSDFFYDPKSKMYYGNKKKAYFRYDDSEDPPFVQVEKSDEAEEAAELTVDPIVGSVLKPKPTIAIKLKTTKKLKSQKHHQGKQTSIATKAEKKSIAYIEKWNEKQAEFKTDSGLSNVSSNQKVVVTSKGEPMCALCRRKFASIEKLRLHERASGMHKANLAKLANAKRDTAVKDEEPLAMNYTDRAQKRRDLHGIDTNFLPRPGFMTESDEAVEPSEGEGLGASNIGNQMLKKMGWQGPEQTEHDDIRKQWDKIESLANNKPSH